MLATSLFNFCFFIYPILAFTDEEDNKPPSCATVMCATPCPAGQYLKEVDGCETCDCYDPCEGVECEKGSCHWKFNEKTRPETFCIECLGGQEWTDCGGGSECERTCSNPHPLCPRNCYPGCQCPFTAPVWDQGKCVAVEDCNGVVIKTRILKKNRTKPDDLQLKIQVKSKANASSMKRRLREGRPSSRTRRIKIGNKATPE